MKKTLFVMLLCACVCAYGEAAPSSVAKPPHKSFKMKSKRVKVYGFDRARSVKKVRYLRGFDYYSYANRPSYQRMMRKAISGSRFYQ